MYGVNKDQSCANHCQTLPDNRLAHLEKQVQYLTKELCNITSLSVKMQYNQQLNNHMHVLTVTYAKKEVTIKETVLKSEVCEDLNRQILLFIIIGTGDGYYEPSET